MYEIWKKENRKKITIDFVMRIPKEEFKKWYEQHVYKKADKMPTISDMEKDYIRFEEAAMLLDVMDQEMLKLIRTSEYRKLFDVRIFNNHKMDADEEIYVYGCRKGASDSQDGVSELAG